MSAAIHSHVISIITSHLTPGGYMCGFSVPGFSVRL